MPGKRLAIAGTAVLLVAGCTSHPGAGIADKIRAANSPIVREIAYSPAAFSQSNFDHLTIYLVDVATDAQALDLWCAVLVPAGIGQLPARAVMLRIGGELAPEGGRAGSKLILTDPVACDAAPPSATSG